MTEMNENNFNDIRSPEENPGDQTRKAPEKPNSSSKRWGTLIGMGAVFGLVAGGVMWGVNTIGSQVYPQRQIAATETLSAADSSAGSQNSSGNQSGDSSSSASTEDKGSVAAVAKNAMPSVVTISTLSVEEMRSFFGGTQQFEVEGAGTGVIVGTNDTELLIATNNHVVEGARSLSVGFIDETTAAGEIKGTDVNNDLAVVAVKLSDIPDETMDQIKVAVIGDSDDLVLGEQVVAIGNALGYGQSVTSGYVSALNRDLTLTDESGNTINSTGLIQTDAAINPGNSGGALLNMKGELIGINEAKTGSTNGTSVDNIGFAIPIDKAESSLKELMNLPTREKVGEDQASFLGIQGQTVPSDVTQLYGIPGGVIVASVTEDGPAANAGVLQGDIITAFDGRSVASMEQLQDTLQYYAAGETVTITVQRRDDKGSYQSVSLSIILGSAKEAYQSSSQSN